MKLKSVILIQKWVRGHLVRLQAKRMKVNFKSMRKFRRILSIAYGRRRAKLIKQLITVLKEVGKQVQSEQEAIFQNFVTHCATTIQSVWRGQRFRKYKMNKLIYIYRRRRLLNALIKGWRTRKIMTQTREFIGVRRDLGETI